MTKVKFFRENNKFVGVHCEGHTGYADSGSDIVCAALSSIIQTAVLGLMQVAGIAVDYHIDEENGTLSASLPKVITSQKSHDADIILKTAYLGASDLYETFSDFIILEVE